MTGAIDFARRYTGLMTSRSKTDPNWTGRVVDMAELGARLDARKAELGLPELPRNPGKNRTASKRALLAEIAKLGGKW